MCLSGHIEWINTLNLMCLSGHIEWINTLSLMCLSGYIEWINTLSLMCLSGYIEWINTLSLMCLSGHIEWISTFKRKAPVLFQNCILKVSYINLKKIILSSIEHCNHINFLHLHFSISLVTGKIIYC